ncbi:flavoprotein [Streptomyces sp. NPDC007100]|uniref:flavoprotein n=1 Tax=Streptomyces sp. NPDC007100 TaxID=3155602 RepID=UPI0033D75079
MRPPLRNVLLAITGSSGAREADRLIGAFTDENINVTAVLTPRAQAFVPPLEVETFTDSRWTTEPWHITLPKRSDAFVVAPATCNTLAKASHGFTDNLALACMASWEGEILFFPGMNRRMWQYQATAHNVSKLEELGHFVAPPLSAVAESSQMDGDAVGWSPEYVVGTVLHRRHLQMSHPR